MCVYYVPSTVRTHALRLTGELRRANGPRNFFYFRQFFFSSLSLPMTKGGILWILRLSLSSSHELPILFSD